MKGERTSTFDPQIFLAKVGAGKTNAEFRRRQIVFSQGDPADAVIYIQKGKIELRVLSQQGREAILATLGVGEFFGERCLAGQPRAWRRLSPPPSARSCASKSRP
jgi:CRP/FNR family transcriptional regulator, cyclic AMP receptor protein